MSESRGTNSANARTFEDGEHSVDTLLPAVYEQLHALAESLMRLERSDHTLQPTALINEAYLRLSQQQAAHWRNRSQFLAVAAQAMRRILVDWARGHLAGKRGSGKATLELDGAVAQPTRQETDVLWVDEALTKLAAVNGRHARLVELRYFGGSTLEEAAEALGVSVSTAERDWRCARAWLYQILCGNDG